MSLLSPSCTLCHPLPPSSFSSLSHTLTLSVMYNANLSTYVSVCVYVIKVRSMYIVWWPSHLLSLSYTTCTIAGRIQRNKDTLPPHWDRLPWPGRNPGCHVRHRTPRRQNYLSHSRPLPPQVLPASSPGAPQWRPQIPGEALPAEISGDLGSRGKTNEEFWHDDWKKTTSSQSQDTLSSVLLVQTFLWVSLSQVMNYSFRTCLFTYTYTYIENWKYICRWENV